MVGVCRRRNENEAKFQVKLPAVAELGNNLMNNYSLLVEINQKDIISILNLINASNHVTTVM